LNSFIHTWTPTFWCHFWWGYQRFKSIADVGRWINLVSWGEKFSYSTLGSELYYFWFCIGATFSPWGRKFSYLTLGPELKISFLILFSFFFTLKTFFSSLGGRFSYPAPSLESRIFLIGLFFIIITLSP